MKINWNPLSFAIAAALGLFGCGKHSARFITLSLKLLKNGFCFSTRRIHHRLGLFENMTGHAEVTGDVNGVAATWNTHEYLIGREHRIGI